MDIRAGSTEAVVPHDMADKPSWYRSVRPTTPGKGTKKTMPHGKAPYDPRREPYETLTHIGLV